MTNVNKDDWEDWNTNWDTDSIDEEEEDKMKNKQQREKENEEKRIDKNKKKKKKKKKEKRKVAREEKAIRLQSDVYPPTPPPHRAPPPPIVKEMIIDSDLIKRWGWDPNDWNTRSTEEHKEKKEKKTENNKKQKEKRNEKRRVAREEEERRKANENEKKMAEKDKNEIHDAAGGDDLNSVSRQDVGPPLIVENGRICDVLLQCVVEVEIEENLCEAVAAAVLESNPVLVSLLKLAPSPDSHSSSPAKGNRVTEVVGVINEPEKAIVEQGVCKAPVSCSEPASTECPKARLITSCSSHRSNNSWSWPPTKIFCLSEITKSMKVFKDAPHMPRFSYEQRQICAYKMMRRLSYEVQTVSAESPHSASTIQHTLKRLEKLESHGFYTIPFQVHLNKLCVKIKEEEELKGNLKEVESRICKCQHEKTELDRSTIELGEQIKHLQERFQKQNSLKRLKDLALENLKSQRDNLFKLVQDFQLTKDVPFEW